MNNNLRTLLIIGSLLFCAFVILKGLGDTLTPLIISFVLSYLFFPLVKKLEAKGIKREVAVPGVLISIVLILGLILALVIPSLVGDTKDFLKELPSSSKIAINKVESIASGLGYDLNLSRDSIGEYIKGHINELSSGVFKGLTKGVQTSFKSLSNWIIAILNIFLIPLFFVYVMNDYEKISKELYSFIPKTMRPKLEHYVSLANNVLSGYIRGQLLVALSLASLYAIGLTAIGLKFGLLIGIISGLISIIPYAGFFLGFITAIIIALANFTGIGIIIGVVAVFLIVQLLEGFVITPKLVGNSVGLSAFATMLALIIGGNLFGLVGMLIGIPIAAIGKTILSDLKTEYQNLDLYKN